MRHCYTALALLFLSTNLFSQRLMDQTSSNTATDPYMKPNTKLIQKDYLGTQPTSDVGVKGGAASKTPTPEVTAPKCNISEANRKMNRTFYENLNSIPEKNLQQEIDMSLVALLGQECSFTTEERWTSLEKLELGFASVIFSREQEAGIEKKLYDTLIAGTDGLAASWAGIAIGTLIQYYPKPQKAGSAVSYADINVNYNGRSSDKWTKARNLFKNIVENNLEHKYPVAVRQGVAEAWAYMGDDAATDIIASLKILNSSVSVSEAKYEDWIDSRLDDIVQISTFGLYGKRWAVDAKSEDGLVGYSLLKSLAFMATELKNNKAKEVLQSYINFSCINDSYACNRDQYSFTLGVYASLAGGYYRQSAYYDNFSVNKNLTILAKWHERSTGMGAVPIDLCETAWALLPEQTRKAQNIPKPHFSALERDVNGAIGGLYLSRDILLFYVASELAAADVAAILYGSDAAMLASPLAEGVGAMIADSYGTTASFEFGLMVAREEFTAALASTTVGKICSKVSSKLNIFVKRFKAIPNNLKNITKIRDSKIWQKIGDGIEQFNYKQGLVQYAVPPAKNTSTLIAGAGDDVKAASELIKATNKDIAPDQLFTLSRYRRGLQDGSPEAKLIDDKILQLTTSGTKVPSEVNTVGSEIDNISNQHFGDVNAQIKELEELKKYKIDNKFSYDNTTQLDNVTRTIDNKIAELKNVVKGSGANEGTMLVEQTNKELTRRANGAVDKFTVRVNAKYSSNDVETLAKMREFHNDTNHRFMPDVIKAKVIDNSGYNIIQMADSKELYLKQYDRLYSDIDNIAELGKKPCFDGVDAYVVAMKKTLDTEKAQLIKYYADAMVHL